MKQSDEYSVNLFTANLTGRKFEFKIDDAFFKRVDGMVQRGAIRAEVVCKSATERVFVFSIHSVGTVVVPCDRCLSDLELPIDTTDTINVCLGTDDSDDGDTIVVSEESGVLVLSQPMYEFIALSMPIRRIHEPGQCDEAMMREYAKHHPCRVGQEGGDDNPIQADGEQGLSTKPVDVRWNALKDIISNNH